MSDYLDNLVARAAGILPVVQPRLPGWFEPIAPPVPQPETGIEQQVETVAPAPRRSVAAPVGVDMPYAQVAPQPALVRPESPQPAPTATNAPAASPPAPMISADAATIVERLTERVVVPQPPAPPPATPATPPLPDVTVLHTEVHEPGSTPVERLVERVVVEREPTLAGAVVPVVPPKPSAPSLAARVPQEDRRPPPQVERLVEQGIIERIPPLALPSPIAQPAPERARVAPEQPTRERPWPNLPVERWLERIVAERPAVPAAQPALPVHPTRLAPLDRPEQAAEARASAPPAERAIVEREGLPAPIERVVEREGLPAPIERIVERTILREELAAAAPILRPAVAPPAPAPYHSPREQAVVPVSTRLHVEHLDSPEPAALPPPPTIQISIGRIEVRAASTVPSPHTRRAAAPAMSLDEYLRQRNGGAR